MQLCVCLYVDVTVIHVFLVVIATNIVFCHKPAVDPLLLECSSSGTETQITVDCRTNRPPATITCSFDGELEHPCMCVRKRTHLCWLHTVQNFQSLHVLMSYDRIWNCFVQRFIISITYWFHTGNWPIVINDRTAFSVGNHSVSIAAADSIGLTAQNVVPFTLGNGTRTNSELVCWWKHGNICNHIAEIK